MSIRKRYHNKIPNTRLSAILLAFVGGATDVFSHLQFHSLVATQTGNFVLMAINLFDGDFVDFGMKCLSVFWFTIGFLLGIMIKMQTNIKHWPLVTMFPLTITCLTLPFLPAKPSLWLSLMALGSGFLMLTFNGSQIEDSPFTVMMTSW